jgi:hypothetical protein
MSISRIFPAKLNSRILPHLALGLLLLGLLWRTIRFLLHFPIWGDEALLAVNFATLDYWELAHRLENCQIAPLLFLWGERTAWRWLGPDMLAMRLLPFIAGIVSVLLYWKLTKLMLGPRARLFATGFLAVAMWPVSMSTLLKPYSLDLCMSLVLLLLAVKWLKNPGQVSCLVWLSAVAPFALLASYPAIFVAASASMALACPAWRKGWKTRYWFGVFNLAVLAGFVLALRVGAGQLNTPAGNVNTQAGMNAYWAEGFPPSSPLAFIWWLILALTGQMSAYPVGASNGGSIVTVSLCLAGAWCWIRRGRLAWLILLTGPVFLGIAAAVIHRYPFGSSCRLNQHVAPAVCILAGLGLAAAVGKACSQASQRQKWTLIIFIFFTLVGLGGLLRDMIHPYRDKGCQWMQDTMRNMLTEVPPGEPVVICASPQSLDIVFTWYWVNAGRDIGWDYQIPARHKDDKYICGFYHGNGSDADLACKRLADNLHLRDPSWHLVKRIPADYFPNNSEDAGMRCELFFFARSR